MQDGTTTRETEYRKNKATFHAVPPACVRPPPATRRPLVPTPGGGPPGARPCQGAPGGAHTRGGPAPSRVFPLSHPSQALPYPIPRLLSRPRCAWRWGALVWLPHRAGHAGRAMDGVWPPAGGAGGRVAGVAAPKGRLNFLFARDYGDDVDKGRVCRVEFTNLCIAGTVAHSLDIGRLPANTIGSLRRPC